MSKAISEKRHKNNLKRKEKKKAIKKSIIKARERDKNNILVKALNEVKAKASDGQKIESAFKNEEEAVKEATHMLSLVVPLFNYLIFVNELIENNMLPKEAIKLDLVREGKMVLNLRQRLKNFSFLEDELLQTELLNYGEELQQFSERIQKAIEMLQPYSNYIDRMLIKSHSIIPEEMLKEDMDTETKSKLVVNLMAVKFIKEKLEVN